MRPIIMTPDDVQPVRHVQPITIVHPATVVMPETRHVAEPKSLTPVEEKELTPVKQKNPGEFNEKLTDQAQNVNFSPKSTLNFSGPKLPKKLKYHGRKGRQRTNEQVVELLTFVQTKGTWPHGVSDQMQRYYRREYPEYFRKGRKKGNTGKVPVVRPAPINISARRTGSGS